MEDHSAKIENMPRDQQLELGEDDNAIALRKGWDRFLRSLIGKLTKQTIENFLTPLKPISYDGKVIVLGAPSAFAREWVEKKYAQIIREYLEQYFGAERLQLSLIISKPENMPILGEKPASLQAAITSNGHHPSNQGADSYQPAYVVSQINTNNRFYQELINTPLKERYTFDTFITGKSNRLAQAGAFSVANSPGSTYNPLYLYGSPGLGKTHLMHAIGHHIRKERPDLRVAFISGETFTNHYVTALRERRMEDFRRAYRSIDIWLVDDIQTLASKEQTKEEFFHTFNTLHNMSRQIVITCDRPPRDLRSMDERLRSRFECGLTADIAPPDLEMRTAILQDKAFREKMSIPDDVIRYMANLIQSNIRALEGALIKLIAYASLTDTQITTSMADDVLSNFFLERLPSDDKNGHEKSASVDQIIEAVSKYLNIDRELILSAGNRRKDVAMARQVAMYLCREMAVESMSALASRFGCGNHSSIGHAHARLQKKLESDNRIIGIVANIRKTIDYSI